MPSLFDPSLDNSIVNVAANYGRMVPQHTYDKQGTNFTNFGTRNLRFVKVVLSGTGLSDNDLTVDTSASNSAFSVAVRALQTVAEVWGVFTPSATAFIAVLSDDTFNDGDGDTNLPGGYAQLEDVIKLNLPNKTSTVTVSSLNIVGDAFAANVAGFA